MSAASKSGHGFITYFNSLNSPKGEGLFKYAEVQQLADAYDQLRAENAQLRRVAEAASDYLYRSTCECNEPAGGACVQHVLSAALAELDAFEKERENG